MAFTVLLPVQNRNGGATSNGVAWPAGTTRLDLRLDVTTLNPADPFAGFNFPFDSPAKTIAISADFSFDGGVTWELAGATVYPGSAQGTWGRTDLMYCPFRLTPPADRQPTHIRGTVTPSERITFGLSAQVS